MQLDLPTLLFVSFLAAISAAIGFTSLMLVLRGQAALRIWVASLWVSTIGITLISLRGQIPDFLSIVIANSLIALAGALMVRGLSLHLERPFRWRVPLAIVLAYAAGIAWFAYAVPDLGTRIVLASVQAVVWDVWCVSLLLRFAPREIRLSSRILALVMAADALLFTVRPFVPVSPGAAGNIFHAGAPVTLTYVAGIVISLAAYFALLLMITERLMVDLRRAASIDALTGLLNRGAMLAEGRRALAATSQGRPCAVLALDLDRFKQINDRWGHEGGDAVLVHAAAVLREAATWPGHAIGRYGGEEFLLTLPGANLHEATGLAERLRAALAGSSVLLHGHRLRVTTSIGVAVGEGGAATFEQLVSSADRALYRAKSDGRNCVRQQVPDIASP